LTLILFLKKVLISFTPNLGISMPQNVYLTFLKRNRIVISADVLFLPDAVAIVVSKQMKSY